MTDIAYLLVTSGDGPGECQLAVEQVLRALRKAAHAADIGVAIAVNLGKHGPQSASVSLEGRGAAALAAEWEGTVQWIAQSTLRPRHKRRNWFVGVFQIPGPMKVQRLDPADVTFSTLRAGGPGGQHQNATDSAVRACHRPTGTTVVARDQRSQHRNKAAALQRLEQILSVQNSLQIRDARRSENLLHKQLERGNPVKTLRARR